jgi:hypothetical protein
MVREELSGTDWIVPAARMKAKLEHVVPLSEAAKAIINEMPVHKAFIGRDYRNREAAHTRNPVRC